jgi:hypothetical protein
LLSVLRWAGVHPHAGMSEGAFTIGFWTWDRTVAMAGDLRTTLWCWAPSLSLVIFARLRFSFSCALFITKLVLSAVAPSTVKPLCSA